MLLLIAIFVSPVVRLGKSKPDTPTQPASECQQNFSARCIPTPAAPVAAAEAPQTRRRCTQTPARVHASRRTSYADGMPPTDVALPGDASEAEHQLLGDQSAGHACSEQLRALILTAAAGLAALSFALMHWLFAAQLTLLKLHPEFGLRVVYTMLPLEFMKC